jgi:hypothetical protein
MNGLAPRLRALLLAFSSLVLSPNCLAQVRPCPVPPPGAKLWSDPGTWGGQTPQAGDEVMIPTADVVYMDVDPPALKSLNVMGTLIVGCEDITLACDKIEVHGAFLAGSDSHPFHHDLTITLGNRYHAPGDTSTKAFLVHPGGNLVMHGQPRSHSWLRLDQTAHAGTSTLRLEAPVDWTVGQRLVITSTDFDLNQAEQRRIVAVNEDGAELTLDRPLDWTHWGEVETFVFDQRAEVALLDRNIEVRGDMDSANTMFGGHMMLMGNGNTPIELDWVECRRMGQAGLVARYPIHFHLLGDATGSAVRNCSIHHCYNRSITVHGTNNVLVEGNVSYETFGHAFFLEDSVETGNVFRDNLGLGTRKPAPQNQILPSDEFPSTYWITNTDNQFYNNVAAGSEADGFWYDVPQPLWQDAVPPVFVDNRAHSNRRHGFFTDHRLRPTSTAVYLRFQAYKNRQMGVWHRSYDQAVWEGALLSDNRTGFYIASEGFQQDDFSFITVSNSAVLGESGNVGNPVFPAEIAYGRTLPDPGNPSQTITGFEFYDGLVGVYGSVFAEFQPAIVDGQVREAAALAPVFHNNPWAVDPRNHTWNLTFLNAKVAYLKPPVPTANGVASTMIYDVDGSITGAPDQWIVAATELVTPAAEYTFVPEWNANIVPGHVTGSYDRAFGQILFKNLSTDDFSRIRVDSVDRATGRDVYEPQAGIKKFPISIVSDEEYAITFPAQPTRDLAVEYRFSQPGRFALISIEYAAPAPAQVYVDFVLVPEANSLEDLKQSGGGTYYYDGGAERLWILPVLGGAGTSLLDGERTSVVALSGG